MPLPEDDNLIKLSHDLIAELQSIFGEYPGFRPAHARGVMVTGTFTPSAHASELSNAPHFGEAPTPVTVRFSSFAGNPHIPDNDPNANPRGLSIRFHLDERVHTDIIGHSADGFPVRTGEEFLEFLRALAASPPDGPSPSPFQTFLSSHHAALRYETTPKPSPSSFARDAYFGVTALKFTNKDRRTRFARYRIVPDAHVDHLDDAVTRSKEPNFLFDELDARIRQGPIFFHIWAQLAEEGDTVDDATVSWPNARQVLDLGQIKLDTLVEDDNKMQKDIIFDPIPRVQGIEPSGDPLLELRAAVYLISGRSRRDAQAT